MQKVKKTSKSILDNIQEDEKDSFVRFLAKKNRAINKKMRDIEDLQKSQAEGKELNEEQRKKLLAKDDHVTQKEEYERILKFYREAQKEIKDQPPVGTQKDGHATGALQQPTTQLKQETYLPSSKGH